MNIQNETAPLTDLCVCRGAAVPDFDGYQNDHPEFDVFRMLRWDRENLLRQQQAFYDVMDQHGVRLHFVAHSDRHPWQLYTRDTGFVVGDTLFYAEDRQLPERVGEIALIRDLLPNVPMIGLPGQIEGGDVMPDGDVTFVGLGTRTTTEAVRALADHAEVIPLHLGPTVMHLDTRMTILPGRRALICTEPFQPDDLDMLRRRFRFIEVSADEARAMASNVFVIDPETVVVHAGFPRIVSALEDEGLRVRAIDWSEPNALLGSFRCATMPLVRADA